MKRLVKIKGATVFPAMQSVVDWKPNISGAYLAGKTPALLMIKLRPSAPQRDEVSSNADWMEPSSVTSNRMRDILGLSVYCLAKSIKSLASAGLRQAAMMWFGLAFPARAASWRTSSKPRPRLAPVTRMDEATIFSRVDKQLYHQSLRSVNLYS